MSWKCAVLLVVVVLTGCSADADPSAPGGGQASVAARAAPAFRVDRLDALEAVKRRPPRGLTLALSCRSRAEERCRPPHTEGVRWLSASVATGALLRDGKGMRERLVRTVTAWPSAATARAHARRVSRDLRRHDGDYDIALRETGPRTYQPGDRGLGELHRVSASGWRGLVLRRVFHYVYFGTVPSRNVLGGHAVLRRGRYVLAVEWLANRQATDRRLSSEPARLARGLS